MVNDPHIHAVLYPYQEHPSEKNGTRIAYINVCLLHTYFAIRITKKPVIEVTKKLIMILFAYRVK